MSHSNLQECIAGPPRVFDSTVVALPSCSSIIKLDHYNKQKECMDIALMQRVYCTVFYVRMTVHRKRRLRVFENRVLRKPFGHKSDEVTGEWRKLHNVELNYLKSLPDDPIQEE